MLSQRNSIFAVNPIWDLVGVDFFGDLKVGKEHHQNALPTNKPMAL